MNEKNPKNTIVGIVIRSLVALAALFVVEKVLVSLPMVRELRTPIYALFMPDVVSSMVRLVMSFVVLMFADKIGPQLRLARPQSPALAKIVVSSAHFVAALLAYQGLFYPARATMKDDFYIYQLVFLAIAAIPLVRLGFILMGGVDTIVDVIDRDSSDRSVICKACGAKNLAQTKFCIQCGKALAENKPQDSKCPACGAKNLPEAAFCANCGAKLVAAETPAQTRCEKCGTSNLATAAFCVECGDSLKKADGSLQGAKNG